MSPDRTVRVDWSLADGRMSHVIQMPTVVWVATGKRILDMGCDWDGSLEWHGHGSSFTMHYRRYAQGGNVRVWVEPAAGIFRLGGAQSRAEPLARIHARLSEEIERTTPAAWGREGVPSRAPSGQSALLAVIGWVGFAFLLVALAIWKFGWLRPPPPSRTGPLGLLRPIPTPTPMKIGRQPWAPREPTPARDPAKDPPDQH